METSRVNSRVRSLINTITSLSRLQRIYILLFITSLSSLTVLFILYHTALLELVESWKADILASQWKWLIFVGLTAATSFPPLIGYATSTMLSGYIFGFGRGWAISALGSVLGACFTFVVYRQCLQAYAKRLSASNHHFMALTRALDGREGFKLLVMLRFCPFPYSLSNAAFSTIPSVTFGRFFVATLAGTLRLMVHVFVGSRLASLAEQPQGPEAKIVNWAGVVGGILLGVATGWIVYRRTKVIANRLALERAEEEGRSGEPDDRVFDESDEQDSLLR